MIFALDEGAILIVAIVLFGILLLDVAVELFRDHYKGPEVDHDARLRNEIRRYHDEHRR